MTAPTRDKGDRRITILLVLTGAVVPLVLIGTLFTISTTNTAGEVVKGNEVAGCRSEFNSQVTDARTAFDVARAERDTAATELNLLTNAGLQAAVTDDAATLRVVFERLPEARSLVDKRERIVVDATKNLHDVSDAYVVAVKLSRSNPKAFLDKCKETR
jgi:hypothetical protein